MSQRTLPQLDNAVILEAMDDPAISAEVERLIATATRGEEPGHVVRELYRRFSWRGRSATARGWLGIITAVNIPVIGLDLLMHPDLLVPAVLLRGLAIPLVYMLLVQAWRTPHPDWAEGASIVVFSMCMMALASTLGQLAGGETQERYVVSCYLVVTSALAVIPLRKAWLLVGAGFNCAAYFTTEILNPEISLTVAVSATVFFSAVSLSLVHARITANRVHLRSVMSHFRDLHRVKTLSEANRRLHELATTDALTGLLNRSSIMKLLGQEVAERGVRSPIAVGLIDIDHFKMLNDTFGHLEGDRCLRAVGREMAEVARRSNGTVGRYGGEEFLLVLPRTPLREAQLVCEEFRLAIAELPLDPAAITVSIGVSTTDPLAGASFEIDELLGQADEALYAAKRSGRNAVRTYGVDTSELREA